MSLALSTVIYEWRRYMAAVAALAFSGLLVLAQIGMFVGMGKSFTATVDRSRADLFVMAPKAEQLFGSGGLPRRMMPLVYMNPEVVQVSDLQGDGGLFVNIGAPGKDKRKREYVQIWVVDTDPGALTLPTDFGDDVRQALAIPYTVAIDQSSLGRLGTGVGQQATMNGRAIRVGAVLHGYPNIMQATVVMSRQTLKLLGQGRSSDRVGPMMVRLRDPKRAGLIRDQLNAASGGQYRAWTRAELSAANDKDMMSNQFIGVMLGFSAFLGLAIGLGITWQTLRGAILANIKEFASLRALGVSMGSLRIIILELSFWVGIAGLATTAVLVAGVSALAGSAGIPMVFPPGNVMSTAVFLLVIALLSGVFSLGMLKKSQPADLLR